MVYKVFLTFQGPVLGGPFRRSANPGARIRQGGRSDGGPFRRSANFSVEIAKGTIQTGETIQTGGPFRREGGLLKMIRGPIHSDS